MGACLSRGLNRLVVWEYGCIGVQVDPSEAPAVADSNYVRRMKVILSSITAPLVSAVIMGICDRKTIKAHPIVIAPMVLPLVMTFIIMAGLHRIRRSLLVTRISTIVGIVAFLKAIGFGLLVQIADPPAVAGFVMSCSYVMWALKMEFGLGIPTPLAILTTSGSMAATFVRPLTKAKKNEAFWTMILVPVFATVIGTFLICMVSPWAFPPPSNSEEGEVEMAEEVEMVDPWSVARLASVASMAAQTASTSAGTASTAAALSLERAGQVVLLTQDENDAPSASMEQLAQTVTASIRDLLNRAERANAWATRVVGATNDHSRAALHASGAAATAQNDASTAREHQANAAAAAQREVRARAERTAVVPRLQRSLSNV